MKTIIKRISEKTQAYRKKDEVQQYLAERRYFRI